MNKHIVFLAVPLFVTACANDNGDDEVAERRGQVDGASRTDASCDPELLASQLGLPPHPSGQAVFAEGSECIDFADDGDARCSQIAADLQLDFPLSFYSEGDPDNPAYCGCECTDPEVPPLRACADLVEAELEGSPFGDYSITANGIVVMEQGADCGGTSPARCDRVSQYTDIPLDWVVDPETGICGCQCSICTDDGAGASEYDAYGSGTQQDPYRIYTAQQLHDGSRHLAAMDQQFVQCADLDLQDIYATGETHFAVGGNHEGAEFTGGFHGNGHAILNFEFDWQSVAAPSLDESFVDGGPKWESEEGALGLFPVTQGAVLTAIHMQSPTVSAPSSSGVGALVGDAYETTFDECEYTAAQVSGDANVGGLIGAMELSVLRGGTDALGNVEGNRQVGGLVGRGRASSVADATISDGSVAGASDVGGALGFVSGGSASVTKGLVTDMTVAGTEDSTGGLIGQAYKGASDWGKASIDRCAALGSTTGNAEVGGLIGTFHWSELGHSEAHGAVTGSQHVGGLIGNFDRGSVDHCRALGDVDGEDRLGGVIGTMRVGSSIEFSVSHGDVTGSGFLIGGFVGELKAGTDIANCISHGSVSGEASSIGGLSGNSHPNATILHVLCTGDVTSGSTWGAGLLGWATTLSLSQSIQTGLITTAAGPGWPIAYGNSPGPFPAAVFYNADNPVAGVQGTPASLAAGDFYGNVNDSLGMSWPTGAGQWWFQAGELPSIPSAGL